MKFVDSLSKCLLCPTAVLPYMIQQKSGHIICVSSIQGKISIPYRLGYLIFKFESNS